MHQSHKLSTYLFACSLTSILLSAHPVFHPVAPEVTSYNVFQWSSLKYEDSLTKTILDRERAEKSRMEAKQNVRQLNVVDHAPKEVGKVPRSTSVAAKPRTTATNPHTTPRSEIARLIAKYFPEEPITAAAIFLAESSLDPRAQGWNCRYTDRRGKAYSTHCKPQDRHKAWSVDCGLTQKNLPGTTCPEHAFDIEWSLGEARKLYDQRKWQPWVAHWKGSYKKHLAQARAMYE